LRRLIENRARAVLDRRLDPASSAPLALGLSGGGDSLALLWLAKAWADTHGRPLLALSVDHGLNPDSARWTVQAGEAAARAGARWRALRWEGDKPATGLPAAARAARHRLLAEAARAAGAEVLLLGHTLDDRREAALMRMRDTPAMGEMAEWGPSPAWPEGRGIFLLRPLLEVGRADLRAWLSARGETWLDDPANDDPRYARARARRALSPSPLAGEGGTRALQERGGERGRRALSGEGGETPLPPMPAHGPLPFPQGERGWVTPDGRILIPRAALRDLEPGPLKRLVSAALLCASGTDTPPRGERLERLVEALTDEGPVTASLSGARVTADPQTAQFGREAGERARGGLAPLALAAHVACVWDGRFSVTADGQGLSVGPLAGRMGALSRQDRAWLKALPPAARSAMPVTVDAQGRAALPRPFGAGPAQAEALVEARFSAACGSITHEGLRPS
jgi:tRNA(Ile)-lysidine synthase